MSPRRRSSLGTTGTWNWSKGCCPQLRPRSPATTADRNRYSLNKSQDYVTLLQTVLAAWRIDAARTVAYPVFVRRALHIELTPRLTRFRDTVYLLPDRRAIGPFHLEVAHLGGFLTIVSLVREIDYITVPNLVDNCYAAVCDSAELERAEGGDSPHLQRFSSFGNVSWALDHLRRLEHFEHRDVQRRHLAQLVVEEERNERERLTSVAYGPAPSIWDNPNTVRALLSGHVRLRRRPFTPLPRLFTEEAARRAGKPTSAGRRAAPRRPPANPDLVRPRPQCALCQEFCERGTFQCQVCQLEFCDQLCLRRHTARQEQLRSYPNQRCTRDVYCDISAAPARAAAAFEERLTELVERLDALDLRLDGAANAFHGTGSAKASGASPPATSASARVPGATTKSTGSTASATAIVPGTSKQRARSSASASAASASAHDGNGSASAAASAPISLRATRAQYERAARSVVNPHEVNRDFGDDGIPATAYENYFNGGRTSLEQARQAAIARRVARTERRVRDIRQRKARAAARDEDQNGTAAAGNDLRSNDVLSAPNEDNSSDSTGSQASPEHASAGGERCSSAKAASANDPGHCGSAPRPRRDDYDEGIPFLDQTDRRPWLGADGRNSVQTLKEICDLSDNTRLDFRERELDIGFFESSCLINGVVRGLGRARGKKRARRAAAQALLQHEYTGFGVYDYDAVYDDTDHDPAGENLNQPPPDESLNRPPPDEEQSGSASAGAGGFAPHREPRQATPGTSARWQVLRRVFEAQPVHDVPRALRLTAAWWARSLRDNDFQLAPWAASLLEIFQTLPDAPVSSDPPQFAPLNRQVIALVHRYDTVLSLVTSGDPGYSSPRLLELIDELQQIKRKLDALVRDDRAPRDLHHRSTQANDTRGRGGGAPLDQRHRTTQVNLGGPEATELVLIPDQDRCRDCVCKPFLGQTADWWNGVTRVTTDGVAEHCWYCGQLRTCICAHCRAVYCNDCVLVHDSVRREEYDRLQAAAYARDDSVLVQDAVLNDGQEEGAGRAPDPAAKQPPTRDGDAGQR